MRWHVAMAGIFGLAACGVGKGNFVPTYAAAYCDYVLACSDPAQLTFDGVLSLDDCLAVVGPELEVQADTCNYNPGVAADCLDAMAILQCPAEDASIDDGIPPVCLGVFEACVSNLEPVEGTDAG